MTDAEVEAKFRALAERVLAPQRVDQALDRLWKLDQAATLDSVFAAVRVQ